MAITTLLDPALLPARTMDQDTFNAAMAYLMTNLPTWGAQTNAIQSNLNSIAAGGAYALPYTFSSSASEVVLDRIARQPYEFGRRGHDESAQRLWCVNVGRHRVRTLAKSGRCYEVAAIQRDERCRLYGVQAA
jgi:hypothetical protein